MRPARLRHVHDASLAAAAHSRENRPRHEEETADIGGHRRVPFLDRDLLEQPSDEDACVIDQDSGLADGGRDLLDGPCCLGRVTHVGGGAGGVDSLALQLGDQLLHPRRVRAHTPTR